VDALKSGTTVIPAGKGTQSATLGMKFDAFFEEVTALPIPAVDFLDKIVRVRNATTSRLYVCMQNLANEYEWIQIAVST